MTNCVITIYCGTQYIAMSKFVITIYCLKLYIVMTNCVNAIYSIDYAKHCQPLYIASSRHNILPAYRFSVEP